MRCSATLCSYHSMALLHGTVSRLRISSSLVPGSRRYLGSLTADTPRPRIYTSVSDDPYLNLSIEHYLLQKSHPESTILFLYRNRPCVVIGRNQNPWLEVNLELLRRGLPTPHSETGSKDGRPSAPDSKTRPPQHQPVSLVRRRSGGGTVFHDEGNVNWSVICPPAAFDRNQHAEMVVRALGGMGVAGVRVNSRHDIVQDAASHPGTESGDYGEDTAPAAGLAASFKISGSAYKLTRLRSLHHGTCLLASPNLEYISPLLRSPAEPYIKARGVESVRSKIRNVGVDHGDFMRAVADEFRNMYGAIGSQDSLEVGRSTLAEYAEVRKGYEELESLEWVFGQTPLFTFSTHPTQDDPRQRPDLPTFLPQDFRASLTARQGLIQDAHIVTSEHDVNRGLSLVHQSLHHITDWREALRQGQPAFAESENVGRWLNSLFNVEGINEENSAGM